MRRLIQPVLPRTYQYCRHCLMTVAFLAATASAATLQPSDTEQRISEGSPASLSWIPTIRNDAEQGISAGASPRDSGQPPNSEEAPLSCAVLTQVDTSSESLESESRNPAGVSPTEIRHSISSASSTSLSPEGQPAQDNAQETDTE